MLKNSGDWFKVVPTPNPGPTLNPSPVGIPEPPSTRAPSKHTHGPPASMIRRTCGSSCTKGPSKPATRVFLRNVKAWQEWQVLQGMAGAVGSTELRAGRYSEKKCPRFGNITMLNRSWEIECTSASGKRWKKAMKLGGGAQNLSGSIVSTGYRIHP